LLEKEEIVSKKAKKQLEKIKKTLELPHLKELQNANDGFFGYKNHIAVTEDEQLITALGVTNGNESDTPHFEKLVEQSVERGINFDEVLGDTAYSSAKILEFAESKKIKVVSKLHPNTNATEKSTEFIHFNKDANTFECVCGHLAKKNSPTKSGKVSFNFTANFCKNCPHKKNCITNKSDTHKRICLSENFEIHKKQAIFQKTDYFKERYRRRPIIEGKNAELKGNYGLGRTRGTGLYSMKVQSFVTAFCANVVKITKLATI